MSLSPAPKMGHGDLAGGAPVKPWDDETMRVFELLPPPRRPLEEIPVPGDGLCLLHTATAARDPAAWMCDREPSGFLIPGNASRLRQLQEIAEAKYTLRRLLNRMREAGNEEDEIERLHQQDDSYPGTDQLVFLADILGGAIEVVQLRDPEAQVVSYGVRPPSMRIGHDGAAHWVLLKSYLQRQPLLTAVAQAGRNLEPLAQTSLVIAEPTTQDSTTPMPARAGAVPIINGHVPDVAAAPLEVDGRILVLQREPLENILSGRKTLEIRHQCLQPGRWYLAHKQYIFAVARVGQGFQVCDVSQWQRLQAQHMWMQQDLPYARTWAWPIAIDKQVGPVPYSHRKGAVGTARFRPRGPLPGAVAGQPADVPTQLPAAQVSAAGARPQPHCPAAMDVRRRLVGKQPCPPSWRKSKRMPLGAPSTPAAARRPTRGSSSVKLCQGDGATVCRFSTVVPGERARIPRKDPVFGRVCFLCSRGKLAKLAATGYGCGGISRALRLLQAGPSDISEEATRRVREVLDRIEPAVSRKRPAASGRYPDSTGLEAKWLDALSARASVMAPATAQEKRRFRDLVLGDRARARRHMGVVAPRARRHAEVSNDAGLPGAKRSPLAKDFERWCVYNAWGLCAACGLAQPRSLTPATLERLAKPEISAKACRRCRAVRPCVVPAVTDAPEELRGLSEEAVRALSPLDIDVGPEVRARNRGGFPVGYRQHTGMIKFAWAQESVVEKIEQLADSAMRQRTRGALQWLLAHGDQSAYKEFYDEHVMFLERHGGADVKKFKRWLNFIERPGLECACWPHLFYDKAMCMSVERATDVRRRARLQQPHGHPSTASAWERAAGCAAGATGEDDSEAMSDAGSDALGSGDDDDSGRHSIKRAFAALALSPMLDYAASYEVLHYAYDLSLWSALGSKKNLQLGVPMRVLAKGFSFSPMYWRDVHQALLDLVRQAGYPKVFWTLAPDEWTWPYHVFVRNDMQRLLRHRLHLPIPETLQLAHVFAQLVRGLLTGLNQRRASQPGSRFWTRHILSAKDANGSDVRLAYFLRIEFQDGTRRAPSQTYHGSGRPHLHVLIFAESLRDLRLDRCVSASATEHIGDADLQRYVEGSQLDRDGRTPWPVHEGPSGWDDAADVLRLHHSVEDNASGTRAFFTDVMDVLKCHQDLQLADDEGLLRAYVAKYVSKFSDSMLQEYLSDVGHGDTVAMNVLFRYRPMEPEMILQMFGATYRQWEVSTQSRGRRRLIVPWPDKTDMPGVVTLYENSAWRGDSVSLLEFLRKTNAAGEIAAWLRKKHRDAQKSAGEERSLEDFAREYRMWGEAIVACDMLSRYNDLFYGQWLMLHVPFRRAADFVKDDVVAKVPAEYKYMALALACDHPVARAMWSDPAAMAAEMKQEAHTCQTIETTVAMMVAQFSLVADYLEGRIGAPAAAGHVVAPAVEFGAMAPAAGPPIELGHHRLEPEQRRFKSCVDAAVDRALAVRNAASAIDEDTARENALTHSKILVCFGGPGTGKTTVAHLCILRALQLEGQVLFATPTGQLMSRMRQRYDGTAVEVETCHAAFGLHDEFVVAPTLGLYTLVVIEELSQLSANHFEHVRRLWQSVDCVPTVVFVGDPWQLSGMGDCRPWHAPSWKTVTFTTTLRKCHRMLGDTAFINMLDTLRIARPTAPVMRRLRRMRFHGGASANGSPDASGALDVQILRRLFNHHPKTTILTVTRRGCFEVNALAIKAKFPRRLPLAHIDADLEANPDNFDPATGALYLEPTQLRPLRMPLHRGMAVYLTKNIRKDVDYVNGMGAVVEGYDMRTKAVRVMTATGRRLVVTAWTDTEHGFLKYFPLRPGYASTVLKFQGAELEDVTLLLDAPGVPGAAYTAMSRVRSSRHCRFLGRPEMHHFAPVDPRF